MTVYSSNSFHVEANEHVTEVVNLHTGDRQEFTYSHAASINSNISELARHSGDRVTEHTDDYLSQYFTRHYN